MLFFSDQRDAGSLTVSGIICRRYLAALFVLLVMLFAKDRVVPVFAEDGNTIPVTVFCYTYYGSYSGSLQDQLPAGEGELVCKDFSVSGIWEKGVLSGDVMITYEDGTTVQAVYKNGTMNGKVTETYADGTFAEYSCTKGRPYGQEVLFSADGEVIETDYFYQTERISALRDAALEADYESLMMNQYTPEPQMICGKVIRSFADDSFRYLLVKDEQQHRYLLQYLGGKTDKYSQAMVPNLSEGEEVTAYCFFAGLNTLQERTTGDLKNSYSCREWNLEKVPGDRYSDIAEILETDINEVYPLMQIFYAETDTTAALTGLEETPSYEEVVYHPYLYSGTEVVIEGTVSVGMLLREKKEQILFVKKKNSREIYYIWYSYEDGESLFAAGDEISATGVFKGNGMTELPVSGSDRSIAVYYPGISATDIERVR